MIRVIIGLSEDLPYCHLSASRADLPTQPIPTGFNVLFRQNADLSLLRHPITTYAGIRILTDLPSASPFGYTLGPD